MKRNIPFILLGLGVFLFTSAQSVEATSDGENNRGRSGNNCTTGGNPFDPSNDLNPDDTNFFPFGFLCGTHPSNLTGSLGQPPLISLTARNLSTGTLYTNQSSENPDIVLNDQTVQFTGKFFDQNGNEPKKQRNRTPDPPPMPGKGNVLVWITIDTGKGAYDSSIRNISAGGARETCPGTNQTDKGFGPVFGYRDLRTAFDVRADTHPDAFVPNSYKRAGSPSFVNGVNASPLAYNHENESGLIDCKQYGRMVYWKNAVSGTEYKFDLQLPRKTGDTVCVRMNVSVQFDLDGGKFFPSFNENLEPTQQNRAASHLVKQSKRVCYKGQKPVSSDLDADFTYNNDCSTLTGKVDTLDADGKPADRFYYYYMQYWDAGAWRDVPGSFQRTDDEGNFTTTIDGASMFGNGWDRAFQVLVDKDTNYNNSVNNYQIFPPPGSGGNIFNDDCVNNQPALGVDPLECTDLLISGFAYDSDTPDAIRVHIYEGDNLLANIIAADERAGDYNGFNWFVPESYRDGHDHTFRVFAIDSEGGSNQGPVNVTLTGCGKFVLTPLATGNLRESLEDPNRYEGQNSITPSYPGWSNPSRPAIPATYSNRITKNGANIGGPYPSGSDTFNVRHYEVRHQPLTGNTAGDNYCSHITIDPSEGLVDRHGNVLSVSVASRSDTSCARVHNRPFFKVTGINGVSAGGEFDSITRACNVGGTLGGWHNNSDSGYTYGSSVQQNTRSILDIIGVTSSHGANGGNARLAFANTGATTRNDYSPSLGGNFGEAYCFRVIGDAPAGAGGLAATSGVPAAAGAYSVSGNLTLTGGTLGAGKNISIFVDGDVYIQNDVTYNTAGWTPGSVPSFVLRAKGNIYIAPGVTQLDGVYIAQQQGSKIGAIYTCANGFNPWPAASMYASCKNQLLVNGSFIADRVNLMRSYGSLRDEKPATGGPLTSIEWLADGPSYYDLNDPNNDGEVILAFKRCLYVGEEADPFWRRAGGGGGARDKHYLCVPQSSSLRMAWTHASDTHNGNTWASLPRGIPGRVDKEYLHSQGFPHCAQLNASSFDSHTWGDNWLCANQDIGMQFSISGPIAGKACTQIKESDDNHGGGGWETSVYLCINLAPPGPPVINYTDCENRGTTVVTNTCAAEAFITGPELYLSRPSVRPPAGGADTFDSIASPPPVL